MANSEKSDEKDQLARARLTADPQPEVFLDANPKTLTEDGGTVRLTVSVTNVEGYIRPLLQVGGRLTRAMSRPALPLLMLRTYSAGTFRGTADWKSGTVPGGSYNVTVTVKTGRTDAN